MFKVTTRLHMVVAALFGLYLLLYPGSITLVALDRVPVWGTWMGGALLILQGTLMGLWLTLNYGRMGAVASLWILFLSWLIEHLGATTGFPFGFYSYTDVLQPQILGVVPLAIPFAWLLIVTAAVGVGELVLGRDTVRNVDDWRDRFLRVLMAAAIALLLDVTIEPFAVNINRYWIWNDPAAGSYYGIPLSNFIAWFVTSLVLSWVLLHYRTRAARIAQSFSAATIWPWLPITLYVSNLTMFAVVNLARGLDVAAMLGGLIMLALAANWFLPRLTRLLRRVGQESGA